MQTMSDFVEESRRYEDELVGIETENEGNRDQEEEPYSPDDVRISQKMYSVYQVYHWMENEVLFLSPEFQRNRVWGIERMSLLIESLMLQIPIPSFYFQEDYEGNKQVIDGLQRLSTIYSYMKDEFSLKGLQYLSHYNGTYYSELPRKYKTRIEETQLAVNVLDSKCSDLVKFDVFRRVNTGGIPLNSQEIRNIMATEETRKLLRKMSESNEFQKATRKRIKDLRMDAQELCLRFITFYLRYDPLTKKLNNLMTLTKMLDQTILELNAMKREELDRFADLFKTSMERCYALLGETAFSKEGLNHIINKPLFVSWSVVLASFPVEKEILNKVQSEAVMIQHKYFEMNRYFNAITSSTATKTNMELQFEGVNRILKELFYDREITID